AVKARADWVVTSSCALPIVESLTDKGEKILWAPDKHLGDYIQRQTGADMLLWDGACIVHEEGTAKARLALTPTYQQAEVRVQPVSRATVVALAAAVSSSSQPIRATQELPTPTFTEPTDTSLLYRMQQPARHRRLIGAASAGDD